MQSCDPYPYQEVEEDDAAAEREAHWPVVEQHRQEKKNDRNDREQTLRPGVSPM